MITTQREGERMLQGMVQLVRDTYSETKTVGDGRGLARLEQAWYQHRAPRRTSGVRMLVAAMATVALVAGGTVVFRHFDKLTYQVMNGSIGPGGFVRPIAMETTGMSLALLVQRASSSFASTASQAVVSMTMSALSVQSPKSRGSSRTSFT